MKIQKLLSVTLLIIQFGSGIIGQTDSFSISFEDYNPPSTLVATEHRKTSSKYPFIDVHNHQWRIPTQNLNSLVNDMVKLNMGVMINLSGRSFRRLTNHKNTFGLQSSDYLKQSIDKVAREAPNRIMFFTNIDMNDIGKYGWAENALNELEEDVKNGAVGLKVYKNLGMGLVDVNGERVSVDDTRLDPIWRKCAELGIPVLIHSADPFQFWQPHDEHNERWLELKEKPGRKRNPDTQPSFEQIINEQHNVFKKHKKTKFINAHLGWFGNDLARLGKLFDECPNVYTEIGAVLAELGRQPHTARDFFIK